MAASNAFESLSRRLRGPSYSARRNLQVELATGEPELALLPALCDIDRDFLDVGANNGVYSYYALQSYRTVYALEPHPDLLDFLRTTLKPNGRVLPIAASDHEGVARLSVPLLKGTDVTTRSSLHSDANPGFEQREIEVSLRTIDSLGLDDVGVMKVDVEGHELSALRGAADTLTRCRPVAIVECEERHNRGGVAEAFGFFEQLGYEPFFLHRGRLRPGSDFDPATLQNIESALSVGGARNPDYVNNFIFVHTSNAAALDRIRVSLAGSA